MRGVFQKRPKLARRKFRDRADGMSRERGLPQQDQTLHILLGKPSAAIVGSSRLNRAVAPFPGPDDVRTESRLLRDDAHEKASFHIIRQILDTTSCGK